MHRHQYKGRKLNRKSDHRDLMLRNLTTSLLLHERIKTTLPKAKEVRPIVERLITKAKKDNLNTQRVLDAYLLDKNATQKTMKEIAPLYKKRKGGYTRIIKTGFRSGDGASMVIIELLDTQKLVKKETETKDKEKPQKEKQKSDKKKQKTTKE